jgi:hypothetical protein
VLGAAQVSRKLTLPYCCQLLLLPAAGEEGVVSFVVAETALPQRRCCPVCGAGVLDGMGGVAAGVWCGQYHREGGWGFVGARGPFRSCSVSWGVQPLEMEAQAD